MITPKQQKVIREITGKYDPILVGVFGSYARDEQTKESDLDILIDFNTKVNLLDLIGLEQELSEVLGVKVDLITIRSVNERLMPYIQRDLIRIV
ncbi:nucleotidyltransferase family protein [Telluribacter humicola]|uniref:nucleotidyltransferase family protein n=1 Tax=Telluribacter humicola TaxID=1720261 RepID=UPI001A9595E5|nr:nucleotidyltransferase family protein [Telluribacter humicola]